MEVIMLKRITLLMLLSFVINSHAFSMERFVCNTSKHTIIVNQTQSGEFLYRAWNKPKSTTEIPDMRVSNGLEQVEGTGVCRYIMWTFSNGNVEYIVRTLGCGGDVMPPKNTKGDLAVYINGQLKKTWWCIN